MAEPAELPIATREQEKIIRETAGELFHFGEVSTLRAITWGKLGEEPDLLIARFEGESCFEDYCLTAFILMKDGANRVVSVGLFPGRYSIMASAQRLCKTCGEYYSVFFYDRNGIEMPIGISEDYGAIINRK